MADVKATVWDTHGDRPVVYVAETVTVNGDTVEMHVPRPVAGVGRDGRYHCGPLIDPAVVRRAMMLTENAELRRMGVKELEK